MIKRFGFLLLAICAFGANAFAAIDDDFDFDNFAIEESEDADITTDAISLNPGAMPANVSNFDIAGIMLGMTFDDVMTIFADGGLYAPRQNNAVVYTISPDWRYNLDYECTQQGIFVPDQLEQCIRTLAKNRGLMYASEYHLVRELTGETILCILQATPPTMLFGALNIITMLTMSMAIMKSSRTNARKRFCRSGRVCWINMAHQILDRINGFRQTMLMTR